jgi:DNA modification methylase/ParB-like chromosome segregation protein Spo0J
MTLDTSSESLTLQLIPLAQITERLSVRRLSPSGLARLKASIERCGFLENFPLIVLKLPDGTCRLVDGNHRLEVGLALGLDSLPCVVKTNLTEAECYTLALRCNSAAGTVVPQTLVSYAEFIWARSTEGYTQTQIADMLGWGRTQVGNYAALKQLDDAQAWDIIVTTFETPVASEDAEAVTTIVTGVTFTENLLRSLLGLQKEQQLQLVQALVHPEKNQRITKGKFNEMAKAYHTRNEMYEHAKPLLGDLGEEYTTKLHEEVYSGAYDADWQKTDHPKLHKLLAALRDEWERKQSIHLVCGDFYEEVKELADGCIDLILTDPPYNISSDHEFELEGRSNLSQNFGDWDKYDEQEFLASFPVWAEHFARILREQGSGYVFTSDRYLSHLRMALEAAGLHVKSTLVWHKTNPGTQVLKTNFKSSVEYVLFFTKGQGGHTFNWQGETEMHNFLETPVCAGRERLLDAEGKTLHPTQKPEQVLRHLIEISSNRGDTVFDGFAGVGSTGKVAKDLRRKFIGIEQEKVFFDAMLRRLAD